MDDTYGIIGLVAMGFLALLAIFNKYKEYKKLRIFFKEELKKLDFESPSLYKFGKSMTCMDLVSGQLAFICFNKSTIICDFEADYIINNSTNKVVLAVNENNFELIIVSQDIGLIRKYHLLDIRRIDIIDDHELDEKQNMIANVSMKIYMDDIEFPYYSIDFLRYKLKINSNDYLQIREAAEREVEKIKILVSRAREDYLMSSHNEEDYKVSNVSYNINNVYGSMIGGNQGNATMSNIFYINELEKMIDEQGGEDKEELRLMLDEIRGILDSSEGIKRGMLQKYSEKLEKHSWITGAIAQLTLGWLTGK